MGERLNGIQEVDGSIPFGSTKRTSTADDLLSNFDAVFKRLDRLETEYHALTAAVAVVGALKLMWPAGAPYPLAIALVFTIFVITNITH